MTNLDNKKAFKSLRNNFFSHLKPTEEMSIFFQSENTSFLRVSNTLIRQDIDIYQTNIVVYLFAQKKTVSLSTSMDFAKENTLEIIEKLRKKLALAPELPFLAELGSGNFESNEMAPLVLNTMTNKTKDILDFIPDDVKMSAIGSSTYVEVAQACTSNDLNWFETNNVYFDYTLTNQSLKSVKSTYSSDKFNLNNLSKSFSQSLEQLKFLNSEKIVVDPGKYKVYLSSFAVSEILAMMSWGGFGIEKYKNGASALQKLIDKEKTFSSKLNVMEDFSSKVVAPFNHYGEIAPISIELINSGKHKDFLVNSKNAKRYDIQSNFAGIYEMPRSLKISKGDSNISFSNVFNKLQDGIYLPHLHYLNWSDSYNARITGMTRNGALLIENGKVMGPIKDMRFNISLYDIWSEDNLLQVSSFLESVPTISSYHSSSYSKTFVPSMLVDNFELTL